MAASLPDPKSQGQAMGNRLGIWIDHSQAQLVTFREDRDEPTGVETVRSDVERRHRSLGRAGAPRPDRRGCDREKHDTNRRRNEIRRFYADVVDRIRRRGARAVMIVGHAEAPRELERHIRDDARVSPTILGVERADALTRAQLIAMLRDRLRDRRSHAAR